MPIEQIEFLSVPVAEQDQAKAFYVETLGFETRQDEASPETGTRFVRVAPPGSAIGLALVTWFPSMPAGSLRGLVLRCADVDAEAARLRRAGVEVSDLRNAEWGRFVTFADPDGNELVLASDVRD